MRRLGRKNIGPRVLGTFQNGRFEEYFEARPLTPKELRIPETAKQIAKRMRELHDGIELLDEEREGGPMIFKNWDKWVDRCERVTSWLDKELQSPQNEVKGVAEPWRRRGLVCGVPWAVFRKAVDNYRIWLTASCGGMDEIKRQLVFAHNDVCVLPCGYICVDADSLRLNTAIFFVWNLPRSRPCFCPQITTSSSSSLTLNIHRPTPLDSNLLIIL